MRFYKGLPIYSCEINPDVNDETGIHIVSLVDFPATEVNWQAYDETPRPISYHVDDEEQRKVTGVVMTADKPIYRRDKDGFEYYVVYTPETIEAMAEKWLRTGSQNNVDTQHNLHLEDGIYLLETFIKNTAKGINPDGFGDVKDGSLFATFKVENDDIWNEIKNGTFRSFSLYGWFDVQPLERDLKFEEYNKRQNNRKKMSKFQRIKEMLAKVLQAFGSLSTDKGILAWDGDEDLKVGDSVQIHNAEEDTYTKAEDGSYNTPEGIEIIVRDGKVEEIIDHSLEETETKPEDTESTNVEAEEQPEEVPNPDDTKEEPVVDAVEELRKEVNELFKTVDELAKRVDELEKKPVAEPAAEEFRRKCVNPTKAEGFGRLSEIVNATKK